MKLIEPLSKKNIHRGKNPPDNARRGWLAVNGELEEIKKTRVPIDPPRYRLIAKIRFWFDGCLYDYEEISMGNCFPTTPEQARIGSLIFGLDEMQRTVGCEEYYDDQLQQWELGIVSSHPEFLKEIERRIKQPPEDDDSYYGANKSPFVTLRHCKAVDWILIDKKDAASLRTEGDVHITWK